MDLAPWAAGREGCPEEAKIQVQALDPDTYILRQSICTNFEAPFMYLLFGKDRALLLDTGAGQIPIVETVDELLARHSDGRRRPPDLLVVNTHAHGDHTGGNEAFKARPGTRVIDPDSEALSLEAGIEQWPQGRGSIDLGDRRVAVIPVPGHEPNHIAVYDRQTRILFSGDMMYPGRIYVNDRSMFLDSLERLAAFSLKEPVCHVLGAHVEMTTTPGEVAPYRSRRHPDERPLELSRDHLVAAIDLARGSSLFDTEVHDDFIIENRDRGLLRLEHYLFLALATLVGLASLAGIVHALRVPAGAWNRAGLRRRRWILLLLFLGVFTAPRYWLTIRRRLAMDRA